MTPPAPQTPPPAPPPPPRLSPRLRRVVLALNAAGFALFLVWLFTLRDTAILREQDGILYFLPCLPFLFVFLLLMPRPVPKPPPGAPPAGEKSSLPPPSPRAMIPPDSPQGTQPRKEGTSHD